MSSWLLPAFLAWSLPAGAASTSVTVAPEVYRGEHLVVRAEVPAAPAGSFRLGDVLSLLVTVSWDGESVVVDEDEPVRVAGAWPDDAGLVLLERDAVHRSGSGRFTDEHRTELRFQILGCPGQQSACPGQRRYVMPELTLEYRLLGADTPVAVAFRPQPEVLSVTSAISTQEGEPLLPFSTYFPAGAYPGPVTAPDRTRISLAAAGTGLLMLIGGLLMWPFRLRGNNPLRPAELPRWRELLREVQEEDEEDHFRLAERIRRCLVWYCSDELRLDPIEWMEAPDHDGRAREHAELRALFLDLLHDPSGRSDELRARLIMLLPSGAEHGKLRGAR